MTQGLGRRHADEWAAEGDADADVEPAEELDDGS
jgi:hypothetical protein